MGIPFFSKFNAERKARVELIKSETQYIKDRSLALGEMKKVSSDAMSALMKTATNPTMTLNDELYGSANKPYASNIWQTNTSEARRISRIAYWDSPEAQAMIGRFVDMVYGPRLVLQSMPVWDIIKDAPKDDEKRTELIKNIESRYRLWAKSKKSDYIKDKNHYQRSRENFFDYLLDGEYFNICRYSSTRKRNPLTVQRIKPENVRRVGSKEAPGNKEIDGIEYNARGEAVAYHFYDSTKNKSVRIPKFGPRSGRQLVIHNKLGSGRRGVGILAGIITEITKIADFQALEIQAAVVNAMFAVWVETGLGGENKKLIPKGGITGIDVDINSGSGFNNFEAEASNTRFANGGTVVEGMGEGQKLHSFDTKRPTANFEQFHKAVLRSLFGAKGMPYDVAMYDPEASYSAIRANLLLFWNRVMTLRLDHSTDYEDIIYTMWMWGEVDNNNVDAPGWEDETTREAWSNAYWNGPPRPDIDPMRSAKAHEIEDKMGYKTSAQITAERGGGDWDDNIIRKKTENKIRSEVNEPETTLEKTTYSNSNNITESTSKTEDA